MEIELISSENRKMNCPHCGTSQENTICFYEYNDNTLSGTSVTLIKCFYCSGLFFYYSHDGSIKKIPKK